MITLLTASSSARLICMVVSAGRDKGLSFDPTNAPDADITIPIEERAIGGLGIFLIRSIMNEVSYQRLDGENRLTMKKYIELG